MKAIQISLVALTLGVYSGQTIAGELLLENKTSHRIESTRMHDDSEDQSMLDGFKVTIDGKTLMNPQISGLLSILSEMPADPSNPMGEMFDALVKFQKDHRESIVFLPHFAEAPDMKVVFLESDPACKEGELVARAAIEDDAVTLCLSNSKKIDEGKVWLSREATEKPE